MLLTGILYVVVAAGVLLGHQFGMLPGLLK
jgi:hypothetical protein